MITDLIDNDFCKNDSCDLQKPGLLLRCKALQFINVAKELGLSKCICVVLVVPEY